MEMMKKVGLIALLAAACAAGYYLMQSKMSELQNVMIQKKFDLGKTINKTANNIGGGAGATFSPGSGTNKRCQSSSECDGNLYCFKKNPGKTTWGNCHRKQDAGHECRENRDCSSDNCSNGHCR